MPTPTPSATPTPSVTVQPIADARGLAAGSAVRVRGVVTAALGAVLNESTLAIQDASGGILVRLPSGGYLDAPVGRVLEVGGVLAAPYGNLELRPGAGDVVALGSADPPAPSQVTVARLDESTEGLLARLTATVTRIDSTATSITLFVADSTGEGRVFIDARLGMQRSDFAAGQTLAVVGVVGDRLGLYRLWPRDASDITLISNPPVSTPTPSPAPTRTPTPTATATPTATPMATVSPSPSVVVAIAEALRRQGTIVAIEGVVTVNPGLLDSDDERVTLQDSTAAILARLPADLAAQVGQRLHLTGTVGSYYGAPYVTAHEAMVVGQGAVAPVTVGRAPLATDLEWQLVTVSGRVESVHRDGDAWRAELAMPGGSVLISGLSRSGIPSDALVSGRSATVTGIVKRAYPTASDQRMSVVPRSADDIRLGPGSDPGAGASTVPENSPHAGPTLPTPGGPSDDPANANGQAAGPHNLLLADLAAHATERVTIGGSVTQVLGPLLTIADESGSTVVRLTGQALAVAVLVGVGDLVNATGTVERTAAGGLEVVVDDPAGLGRLAQLPAPLDSPVQSAPPVAAGTAEVNRGAAVPSSAWLVVLAAVLGLAAALLVALTLRSRAGHVGLPGLRNTIGRHFRPPRGQGRG